MDIPRSYQTFAERYQDLLHQWKPEPGSVLSDAVHRYGELSAEYDELRDQIRHVGSERYRVDQRTKAIDWRSKIDDIEPIAARHLAVQHLEYAVSQHRGNIEGLLRQTAAQIDDANAQLLDVRMTLLRAQQNVHGTKPKSPDRSRVLRIHREARKNSNAVREKYLKAPAPN